MKYSHLSPNNKALLSKFCFICYVTFNPDICRNDKDRSTRLILGRCPAQVCPGEVQVLNRQEAEVQKVKGCHTVH